MAIAFSSLFCVQGFAAEISREAAKKLFVEVERIARQPEEQQRKRVPHLYRHLFSFLERSRMFGLVTLRPSVPGDPAKLSPEQLADAISSRLQGEWLWLYEFARETCIALLRTHQESLAPLVRQDFKDGDDAAKERALRIVGRLRMKVFFDEVLAVFQRSETLSERASCTLRDMDDPRAIRPLMEKYAEDPLRYYCVHLRHLCRSRPADPALVKLLKSDNAEIRWKAACALAESGDDSLIPEVERLSKDRDPRVRRNAANMGFCLGEKGFTQVRPTLVRMLRDRDISVRVSVAVSFAQRKDAVCARTLLGLVKSRRMDELSHWNIVQTIQILMGTDFGYDVGTGPDGWRPTTRENRSAIRHFARWVKENAARE